MKHEIKAMEPEFLDKYSRFLGISLDGNLQVVTNLQQTYSNAVPITCQQDVFVPSLLTSCQAQHRLVTRLLSQQTCYKLFKQLVIIL